MMLGMFSIAGILALIISAFIAPNLHVVLGESARVHFRLGFGVTFLITFLALAFWFWKHMERSKTGDEEKK